MKPVHLFRIRVTTDDRTPGNGRQNQTTETSNSRGVALAPTAGRDELTGLAIPERGSDRERNLVVPGGKGSATVRARVHLLRHGRKKYRH